MILYVEQPFPYELRRARLMFMFFGTQATLSGRERTRLADGQVGARIWVVGSGAQNLQDADGRDPKRVRGAAHGMGLMVQDLTNPMLAQIPHVLLAAHTGTIMGVETNAMQFYPEPQGQKRRFIRVYFGDETGKVSNFQCTGEEGFGYRLEEIKRELPEPAVRCEA